MKANSRTAEQIENIWVIVREVWVQVIWQSVTIAKVLYRQFIVILNFYIFNYLY